MFTAHVPTRDGNFVARFTGAGLKTIFFPNSDPATTARLYASDQTSTSPNLEVWVQLTANALEAVLAGQEPESLPPFDWAGSTVFQRRIWEALLGIPSGTTRTYAEIARDAGHPKAVRAAGGACGANPIPVLVPCHRVLAANRRIGGFSAGLDWKRRLLAREGISYREQGGGKSADSPANTLFNPAAP